jgi:hypothetical protein
MVADVLYFRVVSTDSRQTVHKSTLSQIPETSPN